MPTKPPNKGSDTQRYRALGLLYERMRTVAVRLAKLNVQYEDFLADRVSLPVCRQEFEDQLRKTRAEILQLDDDIKRSLNPDARNAR